MLISTFRNNQLRHKRFFDNFEKISAELFFRTYLIVILEFPHKPGKTAIRPCFVYQFVEIPNIWTI